MQVSCSENLPFSLSWRGDFIQKHPHVSFVVSDDDQIIGHIPFYDQPEVFNDLLVKFLG